jgi:hypothetical protein
LFIDVRRNYYLIFYFVVDVGDADVVDVVVDCADLFDIAVFRVTYKYERIEIILNNNDTINNINNIGLSGK